MSVVIKPNAVAWNIYSGIHNDNVRLKLKIRQEVVDLYNSDPAGGRCWFERVEHMTGKEFQADSFQRYKIKFNNQQANIYLQVGREILTYLRQQGM
jgi:hypothetical protein